MKLYKDKDPYVYNDSLFNKQRKRENRIKRIISALMACEIFCSVMAIDSSVKYEINHSNSFDEQSISSSDFVSNYKAIRARSFIEDESFKETIQSIKNSDINEKKAYLLYYALLSNESLTKEEKENLTGYIQYFIDNKYLDYEYVYKQFSTLKIAPINKDLGSAGTYTAINNTINFDSEEARKEALTHEAYHSEDKSGKILSYNDYAWFIEGLTSVLNYEYFDKKDDGYDAKASFIRILCLFVGSDKLFETRATGDINVLINALMEKGIKKDDIDEIFNLINQYNFEENKTSIEASVITFKLKKKLWKSYKIINKDSKFVNPLFCKYLNIICNPYIAPDEKSKENIYYFNKEKMKETKIPNTIYYHNEHEKVITYHYDDYYIRKIYVNDKLVTTNYNKILKKDFENDIEKEESMLKQTFKEYSNGINK